MLKLSVCFVVSKIYSKKSLLAYFLARVDEGLFNVRIAKYSHLQKSQNQKNVDKYLLEMNTKV